MRDCPVETFHYETVVSLVHSHQKRSGGTVDAHAAQKFISVLLFIVLRVGDHLDTGFYAHFVC